MKPLYMFGANETVVHVWDQRNRCIGLGSMKPLYRFGINETVVHVWDQ